MVNSSKEETPEYNAATSTERPEWEKALRAIVVAGELGCPGEGLALVARKALQDCGVPYEANRV